MTVHFITCIKKKWKTERVWEDVGRSYVGELAHSVGFDSDVVLLELLFDLIDARGDVLGLRADKQQAADQIGWSDIQSGRPLQSTRDKLKNPRPSLVAIHQLEDLA